MIKKILIGLLITLICLIAYIFLIAGNIKYTEEKEINANIETVVALFDNPYNMEKYMHGIESYTVLNGNLREVGTRAEIVVSHIEKDVVKRRIVMVEEIITNNLPEEKKVTYTALIYLTDGEAYTPDNCPKNALWVHSSSNYCEINEDLPGHKIQIN